MIKIDTLVGLNWLPSLQRIGRVFTTGRARQSAGRRLRAGSLLLGLMLALVGIAGGLTRLQPVLAASASTINFQARLQTNTGAIVADGNYNLQFKLYNVSTGGTALWTETYQNSAGQGVQVTDGYLSVGLGSITSFPGTINWDQDLWLTMNIGGTTTGAPTYDGEMSPRLKLTAVPYAFRAGQLAKLTGVNTSTLDWAAQTVANSILLPNEGGTLCIQGSSNCNFAAASGSANYVQNGTAIQANTNFAIQSAAAASVGGIIRGATSQTANLQEWQSSTGSVLARINSGGGLVAASGWFSQTLNSVSQLVAKPANTSTVPVLIQGAASQTADLLQLQNSAGTVLASVDAGGNLILNAPAGSTGQLRLQNSGTDYFTADATNKRLTVTGGELWVYNNLNNPRLILGDSGASGQYGYLQWDSTNDYFRIETDGTNGLKVKGNNVAIGNLFPSNPLDVGVGATNVLSVAATTGAAAFKNAADSTTAFQVQNAGATPLLSVDTTTYNLISNGSFEPSTTGWSAKGSAAIARSTAERYTGAASGAVTTTATAGDGISSQVSLSPSTQYTLSFMAKAGSTFNTMSIGRQEVSGTDIDCATGQSLSLTGWTRFSCTFTTGATITAPTSIYIKQSSTTARTFYIDAVQLEQAASLTPYHQGALAVSGVVTDPLTLQNASNSSFAFQIADAGGTQLLKADTLNQSVSIGSVGAATNAKLLVTGTSGTGAALIVNASGSANSLKLQNSGTDVVTVTASGATTLKNSADSTAAFQVQNAAGTSNLLVADTTNTRIGIGTATPVSLLQLGSDAGTVASGITFGSTGDTNLYRQSAGLLRTTSSMDILNTNSGAFSVRNAGGTTYFGVATAAGNTKVMAANGADIAGFSDAFFTQTFNISSANGSAQFGNGAPSTGLINLAQGTAPSSGIQFGSDTNLYRNGVGKLQTDGKLYFNSAAATNPTVGTYVTGDSFNRYSLQASGTQEFGTGAAARDTQISRGPSGGITIKPISGQADQATAFQVQNAAGTQVLTVDTSGSKVAIGGGSLLNAGQSASAPASPVNGSVYYDTTLQKMRLYQDGAWQNITGGNAGQTPSVSAYNNADIPVANAAITWLTFNSERWDTDSMHDLVTNNGRIVANTTGKYLIHAQVRFAANSTGTRQLMLRQNGTTYIADVYPNSAIATNDIVSMEINKVISLSAGDYIEVGVWQNSGATLNVSYVADRSPEVSASKLDGGGAGGTGSSVPAARVYNSVAESIASSVDTALTFDSERSDTDSIHSTVTNTTRLTANTAGFYTINSSIEWGASTVARGLSLKLKLNGTTEIAKDYYYDTGLNANISRTVSTTYYLNAGDYVETVVFQNSGAANNINAVANYSPEFSMVKLDGGLGGTLQGSYDSGNLITTTDARDVKVTLADTTTDANFILNVAAGSTGQLQVQNAGVNTFTVGGTTGAALFKNNVNSTSALQVQNAAGTTTVLNADTTNARVGVGTPTPQAALHVAGGIISSSFPVNGLFTDTAAPAQGVGGGVAFSGDCGLGGNLLAGGDCRFAGIRGTKENATSGDKSGSLLFFTRAGGSTALSQVASLSSGGAALFQNSANSTTAFRVQDAAGTKLLTVNSTNQTVGIGSAGALSDAKLYVTSSLDVIRANGTSTASNILELQKSGTNAFTVAGTGNVVSSDGSNAGLAVAYPGSATSYVINNGISAANNEAQNPGFELSSLSLTDGSSGWRGAGAITADAVNAHGGNNYLNITANSTTQGNGPQKVFAVTPGETIYAEVWVKTASGTNGSGGFYWGFDDKDHANTVYVNSDWTNPGTAWTRRTVTATVPAGKYYANFTLTVRNDSTTGSWQFDDALIYHNQQAAPALFKNNVDSTTAFQVQNAAGTSNLFVADTTNNRIGIGTAAPSSLLDVYATGTNQALARFGGPNVTDSPSLRVYNGAGLVELFVSGTGGGYMTNSAQGDSGILLQSGKRLLIGVQNSTPVLTVDGANNRIGIGTATPATPLEVMDSSSNDGIRVTSAVGSAALNLYTTDTAAGNRNWRIANRFNTLGSLDFMYSSLLGGAPDTLAMTINNSGNVGIGTTNPAATKLYVRGTASNDYTFLKVESRATAGAGYAAGLILTNTNGVDGQLRMADSGSGTAYYQEANFLTLSTGTGYGVKVTTNADNTAGVKLLSGATSWSSNSDIRLKDIIGYVQGGISKVNQVRNIIYKFKTDPAGTRRVGVVAQDIQQVLPEAVDVDPNTGYLSVRYSELVPLAFSAIQELDARTRPLAGLDVSRIAMQGSDAQFNNLNVSGRATISDLTVVGTATVGTLTVTGSAQFAGDITVGGHIITAGGQPAVQVQAGAGSGASVSIDGNDTSGTITITTGRGPLSTGDLVKLVFSKPYGKPPRILITGQDGKSARAGIFPAAKTATDFMLRTDLIYQANTTYSFDYFIVQ